MDTFLALCFWETSDPDIVPLTSVIKVTKGFRDNLGSSKNMHMKLGSIASDILLCFLYKFYSVRYGFNLLTHYCNLRFEDLLHVGH